MKFLAQFFFKATMLPLVQLFYRVRKIGRERVPVTGGVLLLSNHVSYIDSFVIYLCSPRPVRFVILEAYTKVAAIGWFLKLFGVIPIRKSSPKDAIVKTAEALQQGDVVCLFPEGGLTRLGVMGEFKKGFELMVRKAKCPVVPVYMDGLWNSIFSFERGKYFKKRPNGWTCPLQVSFGEPIPAEEATAERVRRAVWEQSAEAFSHRREFDRSLEVNLIHALKRKRRRSLFVEYGLEKNRDWSRAYVTGMAMAMARRWINHPPETGDRIGILLPPGPMSAVINMGLFLAGKTPVNLPFTIDQRETEAVAKAIAPLGIRTVITSRAFMPHLMDFWHGDEGLFLDLKAVVSSQTSPIGLFEQIRATIEPAWLACWRLNLKERDLDREAVGIVPEPGNEPQFLTAREVLANALQVKAADFVTADDTIFTEESLCRPEGLTLGCWTPALGRGRVVARAFSQRDSHEILEKAILNQEVTVVAGSSAFFKGIVQPLAIRSIKYGLVFGPAMRWDIEDWESTLDIPLARGWSFHGRVVTLSRTDPNLDTAATHQDQKGRDPKSVGRPLPGISLKEDDGKLEILFSPVSIPYKWIPGPGEAEIDTEGFLYLRGEGIDE